MSYASSGHDFTPPPSPFGQGPSFLPRRNTGGTEASSSAAKRSTEDPPSRQEAKIDQLVQHLYSKAVNVISSSRLTHRAAKDLSLIGTDSNAPNAATHSQAKRIDKWFNLELEELDLFRDELRAWRSVTSYLSAPSGTVPSMILDVILDTSDLPSTKTLVLNDARGRASRVGEGRRSPNILLERWVIDLRTPGPPNPPPLPGAYKQGIILFRALYALVQSLPTADLHRRLQRRMGGSESGLKLGCRLSTGDNLSHLPDDEYALGEALTEDRASAAVERFPFAPIQTPVGLAHLECTFRKQADFAVQDFETVLSSRFFDEDYFRSAPTVQQRGGIPGSMPSTGQVPRSPPSDVRRPTYGSLSSRHRLEEKPAAPSVQDQVSSMPSQDPSTRPLSSMADYLASQEGAFVTDSRTRAVSGIQDKVTAPAELAPSPKSIPRRLSVGPGHPFKSPSPSSASPSPFRQGSGPSPRDILPLATSAGRVSGSPGFGPSSSLRYQSPTYFDAMHHGQASASASGSSSKAIASSLRRYSSRGAYGASSSSGGSASPAPGGAPSSSYSAKPGLSFSGKRELVDKPTPEERDEISAFLELLDQKPAIAPGSASSGWSRSAADERLRALAGSLYREGEPVLLRPRVASRLSIEEERASAGSSPPAQGSGAASVSSGAISSQPVASSDSFPRYVPTSARRLSHARRRSSTLFDESEAVGRLELSQEDSATLPLNETTTTQTSPGAILHAPIAHRSSGRHSSRPASAMSSRRESSADAGEALSLSTGAISAAHHMPLGRGRGRPGRIQQEREREWEERRLEREVKSGSSSKAGSSRASSRASSVG